MFCHHARTTATPQGKGAPPTATGYGATRLLVYRGGSLHQLLVTRKVSTGRLCQQLDNIQGEYRRATATTLDRIRTDKPRARAPPPPEPTAPLKSHFFNFKPLLDVCYTPAG